MVVGLVNVSANVEPYAAAKPHTDPDLVSTTGWATAVRKPR